MKFIPTFLAGVILLGCEGRKAPTSSTNPNRSGSSPTHPKANEIRKGQPFTKGAIRITLSESFITSILWSHSGPTKEKFLYVLFLVENVSDSTILPPQCFFEFSDHMQPKEFFTDEFGNQMKLVNPDVADWSAKIDLGAGMKDVAVKCPDVDNLSVRSAQILPGGKVRGYLVCKAPPIEKAKFFTYSCKVIVDNKGTTEPVVFRIERSDIYTFEMKK